MEDGNFYYERLLSAAWQGDPSALEIILKVDRQYTMCTGEVFATFKQKDQAREVFHEIFCNSIGFETIVSMWGKFGLWNEACFM
ncbi:MAG: hypothetical protein ABI618_11815 [Nitrospirota bacterium]